MSEHYSHWAETFARLQVSTLPLLVAALPAGFATLVPMLPTLLTNYFASRIAGHAIDCEQYVVNEQPAACQDAHADVVVSSTASSVKSCRKHTSHKQ